MNARTISSIALAVALGFAGTSITGCGHSEDEWQAQLAKEKKVQADLDAERAAHQKTQAELKKVQAEVAQLKKDLAAYEDLKKAFGSEKDKAAKLEKALAEAEARAKALEAAKKRLEALKKKLDELKKFNLKVAVRHNQIVIEMPGDVLFAPGSELLSKEGKEVLLKVADVIKGDADLVKRSYQVIGHTDNAPYGGGFKDNVGLSVMRAREVYEFLTRDPSAAPKKPAKKDEPVGGGLPADRWSAAGYGDLDPIAGTRESQTPEEKKRNRRVEIAILPDASELMKLDVE
ncbi:MAG: OmpA family protein [Deltaproteobacteria bacterium]|nr:OmpA family protein [Deltaproteobacteria bacterium]